MHEQENADGEWLYEGVRLGRATRTAKVYSPDEGRVDYKQGTILFEPINEADSWMWEEEDWIVHYYDPDLEAKTHIPFERVGIIELPHPMTNEEINTWIGENENKWRHHLDTDIESDTTAEDLIGEVR